MPPVQLSVTSRYSVNRISLAASLRGPEEDRSRPALKPEHGFEAMETRRLHHQLSEEQLTRIIEGCRAGSETAWQQLIEAYKGWVYHLAYGFVRDPSDAEDLAQDVFVEVHRWLRTYRGEAQFSTWLYRVATNVCLRAVRGRGGKNRIVAVEDLDRYGEVMISEPPEETAMHSESRRQVQRMVAELPEHYRAAVVLCDLQELTYEEAAKALRVSIGTVRSRVHRGRNLLKSKLKEYFHETGRPND